MKHLNQFVMPVLLTGILALPGTVSAQEAMAPKPERSEYPGQRVESEFTQRGGTVELHEDYYESALAPKPVRSENAGRRLEREFHGWNRVTERESRTGNENIRVAAPAQGVRV